MIRTATLVIMVACYYSTSALTSVCQKPAGNLDLPEAAQGKDTFDISFESDGLILNGLVKLPSKAVTKMPAVIFLPGSGGSSSHNSNYKNFLGYFLESQQDTLGLVLMYFDKRGVGKSQGTWYTTDFEKRALDARNAAKFLVSLPFVDEDKIYLVGHSQGGWIVQIPPFPPCSAWWHDKLE